jgi:ATP-binding cassette subfamily C (CFTR/MRP) protein 1
MFAGTIRLNLDPFDEHPDVAVWEVLDKVGRCRFTLSNPH